MGELGVVVVDLEVSKHRLPLVNGEHGDLAAPTSIATAAAPLMNGYCAGASDTSVHTHTAHRPSHASLSTQLAQASSDAVPP